MSAMAMKATSRRDGLIGCLSLLLGLLSGAPAAAGADADGRLLPVLRCGESVRVETARANGRDDSIASLHASAGGRPAVLVIEERGNDVAWRTSVVASFEDIAARPPRFGLAAWPVQGSLDLELRAGVAGKVATARASLYCSPPPEIAALPICLHAADAWRRLVRHSDSSLCSALAAHAAAATAARAGDNELALRTYHEAAGRWSARQDGLRQGAALLGATEVLVRLGRYEEALREAQLSLHFSHAAGNDYFAARGRNETCLALRALGRLGQARECQSAVATQFLALGEAADAANAYVSLGGMALADGDAAQAAAALARLQRMDLRNAPADVVPRSRMLAANLALREGEVGRALEAMREATDAFERAGSRRWQANAEMRIAAIYAQIGAWTESREFARAALSRLSPQQSVVRYAQALRMLAVAQAMTGEADMAAPQFAYARSLLAEARQPIAAFAVDLAEAGALKSPQSLARAVVEASTLEIPRDLRIQLSLLQVEQALRQGDLSSARELIETIPGADLPLASYLRWRIAQAQLTARRGDAAAALKMIEQDVDILRGIAQQAGSPALRYIASRRLLMLRAAWVDLVAPLPPAQRPTDEAFWLLLQKTQRLPLLALRRAQAPDASELDRHLAALLLDPDVPGESQPSAESNVQRELMRYYLESQDLAANPPVWSDLGQLRRWLPANAKLLAFAFGDEQVLVLSADRNGVRVRESGSVAAVRDALRTLQEGLRSPATPVARIRADAARLSALLFAGEHAPAPERLLLLQDENIGGMPAALLEWPGSGRLLDTTATSVVPALLDEKSFQPLDLPRQLAVLVSPSPGGDDSAFPVLLNAGREAEFLRTLFPLSETQVFSEAQFTRRKLIESLALPGGWVHIAAHGASGPRLQSYSGLWLSPEKGDRPELATWLELSEREVGSSLLVLSACQLGGDPGAESVASASFAAALSAAGARNVVAALWPLSDAASAQFSKTFYARLAGTPPRDVAVAVLAAQRQLQQSTHFRHPYYWSLFVHLQH
jgi:tetratricopeptide (TPR) repeat protein